jgi:hypothetical protein
VGIEVVDDSGKNITQKVVVTDVDKHLSYLNVLRSGCRVRGWRMIILEEVDD